MKTVLIDDEVLNLELLQNLFARYCPTVEVIGCAYSVEEAIEQIMNLRPDVIFLDIELNNLTAEDLLRSIDLEGLQVVIISAYEKYALRMHKYPVTDYLLKPVLITDLITAVQKVQKHMDKSKVQEPNNRYIALPEKDHLNITTMEKIIRLEGMSNYTRIIMTENKVIVSSKTLRDYEDILPRNQFIRVHNSHIVNIDYVSKYMRTKNGSLILKDGTEIPISANRKKEVIERIVF